VLATGSRTLDDFEVTQPPRFVQRTLHRRPADTGKCRNLIDRKVANPGALNFSRDDTENRSRAFGIVVSEIVGQSARAAEHAAPVSRCLSVRRALALTLDEATTQPFGDFTGWPSREDCLVCAPLTFDKSLEVGTLIVAEAASTPSLPKLPGHFVQLIWIAAEFDGFAHCACD
jgi:hypothetical protein